MMLFRNQPCGVSIIRLYVMRALFLVIALLFGVPTWMTIVADYGQFEALEGVAYSFWGALCILAFVGVRFPMKMLPVLLIQFLYKSIWLVAVGYPLMQGGEADDYANALMGAMTMGVVLDVIAIPWLYVFKNYIGGFFRRSDP